MRRPISKGLFILSPVLVTGSLVRGTTVYDSGGFESPRFTTTFTNNSIVGNLHSQDSGVSIWKESTTDPSGITDLAAGTAIVQASGGGANLGAQDILVTRTQYDDRWAPSFTLTPTSLNLITISWDMQVNQAPGSTSNLGPFFGIEANDATSGIKPIGALGVDATTGELLVYDKTVGGLNILSNDAAVTLGQFNHFALTLDYSTDTYAVALNGVTEQVGLGFFTAGVTHFTDADIAALQAAATAQANQAGTAVFDNYLITNTTGLLPIVIYTGNTLSTASDAAIGVSGDPVEFAGGTLATTASFSTARALTIDPLGGNISAATGATLTLTASSLTWAGSTLTTTGPGKISFALGSAAVSVTPGSTLNISASSSIIVGGTTDPFTDSSTPTNHVAIVNNGSLAVNVTSTVAKITGNGQLTIGTGSTTNTLQLATNGGGSSVASLTINTGAKLDLANNHLIINYGTGADPRSTLISYLHSGYNAGKWNGAGIDSSTAASKTNYGVGLIDFTDGISSAVTSGQIEIAYALYGDVNLDGLVNATDFSLFAANFGTATSGWDKGDFNYDGTVNASDFSLLGENFGTSATGTAIALPSSDWAALDSFAASEGLSITSVPEPTSAAIFLLATAALLPRRRRSK